MKAHINKGTYSLINIILITLHLPQTNQFMSAFSPLFIDKIRIVKKDDSYTSIEIPAFVKTNEIHVHAESLPEELRIEAGDYIDRIQHDKHIERYYVVEPNYKAAFMTIPAFYEIRVRKQ